MDLEGSVFTVLPRHSSEGTEENDAHISYDDQSPSRDLKPGPSKYEVGVLTTRPRRSVLITRSSFSLEADSHLLFKKFPPFM
jgi:hypothetical protein